MDRSTRLVDDVVARAFRLAATLRSAKAVHTVGGVVEAEVVRHGLQPVTGTPRAASGRATRPVPTANSSARPPSAATTRRSTVGPRTSGANIPVPGVS